MEHLDSRFSMVLLPFPISFLLPNAAQRHYVDASDASNRCPNASQSLSLRNFNLRASRGEGRCVIVICNVVDDET